MKQSIDHILSEQIAYAARHRSALRHGLTLDEAFVRGIRHIGYRSNLHAIAELIDNAIQAYAERVELIFGYEEQTSTKKPNRIAVIDDGHGMHPDMLRLAMMWGGTHREDDRGGLGRYGYGLPCAAVSIGRRFKIISKLDGGSTFEVTLDLDALDRGLYRGPDGQVSIPEPVPAQIPEFVLSRLKQCYPEGWRSGTVVLIEKPDRIEWTTTLGMRANLLRHLGVTYHKLANVAKIFVDGSQVRPVDPLFLSPECDLFDLDEDRAHALDPIDVKIVNPTTGMEGQVTLRYSWLPPSFGAIDKGRDAVGLNANARFAILKDYHGLIFSRNGRLIDIQTRAPWTVFINNDRYIRIEVEFSAALDELFGVTTSKQQVSVSPLIWDALREVGLHKAIEQLRTKVRLAKLDRKPSLDREGAVVAAQRSLPVSPRLRETSQSLYRSDQSPIPLLIKMDGTQRPNSRHPLFTGAAGSATCAAALHKLVDMLTERSSCAGGERQDEYGELLSAWFRSLQSEILK